MGFLASFWGNMASQHQATTQAWKQLWQIDEEREQRERHFQKQAEQADRQYQLDRERFDESIRQFDVNKELEDLRLAMTQQQINQAYASDLMARITPVWENADYVYKTSLLANLNEAAGKNEFLAPWLASLAGATPASDMSVEDAKTFVRAWLDPLMYMNEHGMAPSTSEYDLQQALSVLEGTVGYGELLEEVENTRAAREEQIDFVNTAALDLIALKPLKAAADLRQTDTVTEGLIIDNKINEATAKAQIDTIINQSLLSELQVREGQIQLDYLADQLATNLEISQEQLRELRGSNDLFEELVDVYVAEAHKRLELLGFQTDLAESDLRVAVMTEAPRILGEHLTNDMLRAQIAKLDHDMALDSERLALTKKELGFNLAAAGHTGLLREFGAELFPEFADNEAAMGRIIEFTEGIEEENRAAAAAEVAYRVALTEQAITQTQYIPKQFGLDQWRAQQQNALGWATLEHQDKWKTMDFVQAQLAAQAAEAAAGRVGLEDAVDLVTDTYGRSHSDVMDMVSDYTSFAATVEGLEALKERGGEMTANSVATLGPIMERYGIEVPEIGRFVDLSDLDFVISQAAVDLETQRGNAAREMANLYYRSTGLVTVGEVPSLAEFYGEYDLGASSEVMQNLLLDVSSRSPTANASRIETYLINEGYVRGNPEIFGDTYENLGPAVATSLAVDAMLPPPEQLALLGPDQVSALYNAVLTGPAGALAGLNDAERQQTLDSLNMGTLEDFYNELHKRSGYREGNVANVSSVLDSLQLPIPEVSSSLFTAEGVIEAERAFNAADDRLDQAYAYVDMYRRLGGGATANPTATSGLSSLLGLTLPEMVEMGWFVEGSAFPIPHAIKEYLDQEAVKVTMGRAALDSLVRGEEPESVSILGW